MIHMLFQKSKYYQARKIHLNSTNFAYVLPVLVTTFDDFNSFLWVFIKVTGFNYIWIKNITLKLDSHLSKLFYLLQQKPFKNDEKFVLFNLKSSFRSQDIQIFVLNVRSCRKGNLIKKIRLVSKFVTWQPG